MYANYSAKAAAGRCPATTAYSGTTGCSGYCATKCDTYTTTHNQEDDPNMCIRYASDLDKNPNACCKDDCGQFENMATCGVIYKDNCNKHFNKCNVGGVHVCTRACAQRCNLSGGVLSTYRSLLRFPTIFQAGVVHSNDCKGDSHLAKTPWQTCLHDTAVAADMTVNDVAKLQSSLGDGNPNYDEFMTRWCAEQVTQPEDDSSSGGGGPPPAKLCPSDAITQAPQKSCARYVSLGLEGQKCSSWISTMQKPSGAQEDTRSIGYLDAIAALYCSKYNTPECSCYNRGIMPQYLSTKASFPYNDGCWFSPCTQAYGNYYFRPSDIRTELRNPPNNGMCPSNVCTTYIHAGGSIDISDSSQYVYCGSSTPTS